jgi:hypothetical protein
MEGDRRVREAPGLVRSVVFSSMAAAMMGVWAVNLALTAAVGLWVYLPLRMAKSALGKGERQLERRMGEE